MHIGIIKAMLVLTLGLENQESKKRRRNSPWRSPYSFEFTFTPQATLMIASSINAKLGLQLAHQTCLVSTRHPSQGIHRPSFHDA